MDMHQTHDKIRYILDISDIFKNIWKQFVPQHQVLKMIKVINTFCDPFAAVCPENTLKQSTPNHYKLKNKIQRQTEITMKDYR